MDRLQDYLQDVIADMNATRPQYARLLRPEVKTHPIPFFGDIKHAKVLTVGINPSADEFIGRGWPEVMEVGELKDRLQQYFVHRSIPPYKWFDTWKRALAPLGVSYQDGAAHIDLSPRATASRIESDADRKLFTEMVEQDSQWFFKLLPECNEITLLLFAGCVTNRRYINKFVERSAAKNGFQFVGRATSSGKGRTGFYQLRGPGIDLPAFFCSVSPSARKREILIQRVEEHKTQLLELLDTSPTHPVM